VFNGVGDDSRRLEHQAAELGSGQLGGLGVEALELAPNDGVVEPAVKGRSGS